MGTKNLVDTDLEWLEKKLPGIKREPITVTLSTPSTLYPQKFDQGLLNQKPLSATDNVEEAVKVNPRLCWVWNSGGNRYLDIVNRKQVVHNWVRYISESGAMFEHAELISREEIEKYLGDS